MLREQGMQPGHAIEAFGYAAARKHLPVPVDHAHVMVGLGPVDAGSHK